MQDEQLWQQILALPLIGPDDLAVPRSTFRFGAPLAAHVKQEILLELRRFLYLLAVSGEELVPSPFIADALRDLVAKSGPELVLGTHPDRAARLTLSLRMGRNPLLWQRDYQRSLDLRARSFGAADPEHIWPSLRSYRLQLAGWALLAAGLVLAVLAKLGADTGVAALALLICGGFIWGTEGPWPVHLPVRQGVWARLR
ncbi:hypothetical protein KM031_15665 [Gemmobacter fulvus]|uniref:Uncharacterized protein n=1 Tax=Gemmobacter fulvus TaxID=2840474 RepID=A0A975P6D4_9RHOB|nr:hypothetical protein [Gemmobacter fulvus]MBT9245457.1 hypothetical protein [Gemmobacter fulvus]QWK90237.1 hypothetical protein KM031_15665 [Gemmobacter fulvus]